MITLDGTQFLISIKHTEFLMEEILKHLIAERFKSLPDDEINGKMKDTFDEIHNKMNLFAASLPDQQ